VKAADGTWIAWELVRPTPHASHGRPTKAPLLVTVNGLSNDGFQWRGLMPTLRKDHAVLSWDYRGHGCSENPRDTGAVSIAALAADMEAVMADVSARSLASTLHVTVVVSP
jgi:pimeloyl-ACP methyl ester carboxylesterase